MAEREHAGGALVIAPRPSYSTQIKITLENRSPAGTMGSLRTVR